MKKRKLNVLNIIAFASFLFVAALLLQSIYLPGRIQWPLLISVTLIAIVALLNRSKIIKLLFCTTLILSSFLILYLNSAAGRLTKLKPVETSVISFYVMKGSKMTKIEDAKGMKLGYSANLDDVTVNFITSELNKKSNDFILEKADDDEVNLEYLSSGKIKVLILDNAMFQSLAELQPFAVSQLVSIWSIEKSIIKEEIVKEVDIAHKPFIVLISGIDIAGPITLRSRSDVNILMVINPLTKKILTVSIPRDMYVNLGCRTGGLDKLTHSGIYGIQCTVKTIENFVGIDVNYYIRLNFTSLIKLVSVIGNIDVYSQYAFDSAGYHFTAGMNNLNATRALVFSRERKSFTSGDIQRGLNQQEVIKAIIKKITTPASVLKAEGIINALSQSIDMNVSAKDMSKLIKLQLDTNAKWETQSSNISGTGDMQPTYSMGSRLLYVMHPDLASLKETQDNIALYMTIPK